MHGMHENQKKLLDYLLEHPQGATLDELAGHLRITKTAAREHLLKVSSLGFLTHHDTKGAVGRPRRVYRLSAQGQEAFPRQYSWLSNMLLTRLASDLGPDRAALFMEKIAAGVAESMGERFRRHKSSAGRLQEIATALAELGYRSLLKQSDVRKGAVIEATNCVYHSVAKDHPELCRFDIKFIEHASGGMKVSLESCIARGGAVCRFCLRRST
jgi:predicted ArsR family transcriptional regulator